MKRFLGIIISLSLFGACLPRANAQESLSWQDCIKEAQKNNPDLISAVEQVNQQLAAKAVTASGLYPQIDSSLSATSAKSASADGKSSTTSDSYNYGVDATQLVFDGFKTVNDVNAAGENVLGARENYRFTSSSVRLSLRTAFVNLLKAQEAIRVAEEILKIRRDNFVLITLRYETGLEHKGAFMTAEANLAEAQLGLARAKRDEDVARQQLNAAMGRKVFRPMQVTGDFIVQDSAKQKPSFDQIIKAHPQVLQAVATKNSAAFSIKSAYANFSPALTGSAGASKSANHWEPKGNNWNLGLSLNMPVFEGGLRIAQVNQARAVYNQAEANERSIKDNLIVSLENTWTLLQDAIENVGVQRKLLEAQSERSKIAEAQYSIGFLTFDNWIIIENDLVNAKQSYLDAQAGALLAEANWINAKGEALEYAQ